RAVPPRGEPGTARRELPVRAVPRSAAQGDVRREMTAGTSETAALLDRVTEELYARHTADAEAAGAARREYEERRGRVHQDDELWEAWSAAFVEWCVVERTGPGAVPPAAVMVRERTAPGSHRRQ